MEKRDQPKPDPFLSTIPSNANTRAINDTTVHIFDKSYKQHSTVQCSLFTKIFANNGFIFKKILKKEKF